MINKAFDLGKEKYDAQDFEGAVIDFTLALEKDPSNPEIYYQRAMSYYKLKKLNLALIDMDYAVEMQPNYAFRYSSRAYMRDGIGDVIGAVQDYKKAIELDPEDAISYNNLGILEDKMGRREISEGYYKKSEELLSLSSNKAIREKLGSLNPDVPGPKNTSEPESKKAPAGTTIWIEMLKVFTKKESFKEFLQYLKLGFKIPRKD